MTRGGAWLFDLDNTLVDRDAAFRRYLSSRWWGRALSDAEWARVSAWDEQGRSARAPSYAGVAEVGRDAGVSMSAQALLDDVPLRLAEYVRPVPGLRDVLKRFPLRAIVSNGSGRNQRAKLRAAGLDDVFDVVVISGEHGVAKPDVEVFDAALRALGCGRADATVVGDDVERDIAPAHDAGMRTVWVSHGARWAPGGPAPSATVADPVELVGWLSNRQEVG